MANKKTEKTVNARKPSPQSGFSQRRRGREYSAILLVSLAVFLALCLVSYDPGDPSFNVVTDKSHVSNLCGLIGSHVGDAFVQVLGICALLIPVTLAGTALRIYRGAIQGRSLCETISAFFLLASACMLVERLIQGPFLGFSLEHTGGALGNFLHFYLSGLLGSVGEMLVGATVILICILNLSKVSLATMIGFIQAAAIACVSGIRHLFQRFADSMRAEDAADRGQEMPAWGSESQGSNAGASLRRSRKRDASGEAASPWMSIPIPDDHPFEITPSSQPVEPITSSSRRGSPAKANGNAKKLRKVNEQKEDAPVAGLVWDRELSGVSQAGRGLRTEQSHFAPDSVPSIPIMDDYEASHGDWWDTGDTGVLPIDEDFLHAKALFSDQDQVDSAESAKETAGASRNTVHRSAGSARGVAGVPSNGTEADQLPALDWSGVGELTSSLEVCNDSLDVSPVAAAINKTGAPGLVPGRANSSPGDSGVSAEIEGDADLTAANSRTSRVKTPARTDNAPAKAKRSRGGNGDPSSSHNDGELPTIDWEECPANSQGHSTRAATPEHVQVSRRADENMEHTDSQENPSVSGDDYVLPSTELLDPTPQSNRVVDEGVLQVNAKVLEQKLLDLKIEGQVVAVHPGPVITMYELALAPGIPLRKVLATSDDLAMALKSGSTRVVAPIPGKDTVGIEVPNLNREIVYFREIVESRSFRKSDAPLKLALGKGIDGTPFSSSLTKMPHLLIAGATGTGKSVGLNSLICSWLMTCHPDDLKLLMVDPKKLELSYYQDIPHLIHPVVTEPEKVPAVLSWAIREMERRYDLLSEAGAKNIEGYNEKLLSEPTIVGPDGKPAQKLPYIAIIVDELAELMMVAAKDIEISIARLAQMARASGIHLILATQRPSVDVITGIIKANFPARLSYQVSAKADSRTILDTVGAEHLLGRGDMLFLPPGTAKLQRLHGAYISEKEISRVCEFVKGQRKPVYLKEITKQVDESGAKAAGSDLIDDEKYDEAVELVTRLGHASISLIQRHMRIGYNRAARIIEAMEAEGIIGPSDGTSRPREVLVGALDHIPDQPHA